MMVSASGEAFAFLSAFSRDPNQSRDILGKSGTAKGLVETMVTVLSKSKAEGIWNI
jgi:hypothetical protein